MGNISSVGAVGSLYQQDYKQLLSKGEGATQEDFYLLINDDDDLKFLVQTTQIPQLGREPIESFGPRGVQFTQQGRYRNIHEIPVTFKEVISGLVYLKIRELVVNKTYFDCSLKLVTEGEEVGLELEMLDCWLELEGSDLSVEDAALIKPSGTLHANWLDWTEASFGG
jgi:hypothetical protein